jgi:predicted flap endonuclease-1-like 5' DNA nuclease
MCIPCILIPILVGLICALLGYLLGKLLKKNDTTEIDSLRAEFASLKSDRDKHFSLSNSLSADMNSWKSKYDQLEIEYNTLKSKLSGATSDDEADKALIAKLQADLDACNASKHNLNASISTLQSDLNALKLSASIPTLLPFDAAAAFAVFGKKIIQDDLKLVEGIGPKIEELFHAAGIKTWKALSETSVDRCKEILGTGGERFQIHDPGTWSRQCLLMYEGKWQELKDWQDKLDGGKE